MINNEAWILAFIGIQAPRLWMPDQVRHDESVAAWLQPGVKRPKPPLLQRPIAGVRE